MIGIYKIQFQILQTSAEKWLTHSVYSLTLGNIFPTQLSLFFLSFQFPFRFHHASVKVQHVSIRHKITQSFEISVRRPVAVTPALLVGRQGW